TLLSSCRSRGGRRAVNANRPRLTHLVPTAEASSDRSETLPTATIDAELGRPGDPQHDRKPTGLVEFQRRQLEFMLHVRRGVRVGVSAAQSFAGTEDRGVTVSRRLAVTEIPRVLRGRFAYVYRDRCRDWMAFQSADVDAAFGVRFTLRSAPR